VLSARLTPHCRERRADGGAGPGHAAVYRAEHHVLARRQAAALLVHRRHIHPATALQVAGELDVADEAALEGDGAGPSGTVIGVNYVQRPAADGEVVKGYVHAPEEWAGRVVVHPHALAVAGATAEVDCARSGGPGNAVRRGPQAHALAAAAGRQVASEPHVQVLIEHHDRVTEVGTVTGAEGLARMPGHAAIGRIRA